MTETSPHSKKTWLFGFLACFGIIIAGAALIWWMEGSMGGVDEEGLAAARPKKPQLTTFTKGPAEPLPGHVEGGAVDAESIRVENAAVDLANLSSLAMEKQIELLNHYVNLIEDENYAPLSKLAVNPGTNPALLDVLLEDLFNRPDALKLPLLLQIAQTSSHRYAVEAQNAIEVYTGENFGTDWPRWEKAIEAHLSRSAHSES